MKKKYSSKVCVILGGSGLIGESISKKFFSENDYTIVIDKYKPKENICDLFIKADCSKEKEINKVCKKINKFQINTIINAVRPKIKIKSLKDEIKQFDKFMFISKIYLIFFSLLKNNIIKNKTQFINISSINSILISQQSIIYHVLKSTSNQIIKNLAVKYGKYGIKLNNLLLGLIDQRSGKDSPNFKKALNLTIPLKKKIAPSEVADLSYYLSEHNKSITGQDIIVDLGMSAKDHFSIFFKN